MQAARSRKYIGIWLAQTLHMSRDMAENTEAAAPEGEGDKKEKKKGGSSNLILIIIAMANFLAVAGLGAYVVLSPPQPPIVIAQAAAPPAEGEEGAEGADAAAEEEDDDDKTDGPLMALDPIVTNLAEPDSGRYLKVTVQIRITSEAARPEVEANMIPMRSQILMFFSSLTTAEIHGADNKRAIQAQVKRIANESMPSSRVTQVYFTEFVIQ